MVVTASDGDTAPAVDVLPGPAHDAPHLVRMPDRTPDRVPVVGEGAGGGRRASARTCARTSGRRPTGTRAGGRGTPTGTGCGTGWSGCPGRPNELQATDPGLFHQVFGFIRPRAKAILAEREVISGELAERLLRATGFRNVLVDDYVTIGPELLIARLHDDVGDLWAFAKHVARHLARPGAERASAY